MKIKKRLLSLFLALTMLTTMVPVSVISASAAFTGALQFDTNGKFTVMQITDIQTGASVNSRIIASITNAIARYSPDLVVFTGDNISGKISAVNFQSAVNAFTQPLINTNTKFAVTFGNHDAESSIFGVNAGSKDSQYNYFMSRGGNLAIDHDVDALDGVGSGVIPIYANGQSSGTPAYQVYLMDSGDAPSSGTYDTPYTNQLDYYIQRSQTYPTVPSLWFQHTIVPDIYTRTMTINASGKAGIGSPYSSNKYILTPSLINWARSSSTLLADIYNEAPCPPDQSLYESTAHRSSPSYGSKTLYEAWDTYGSLKGAYFGHDHRNEFTMTTTEGIDLGYGESASLLFGYTDDNPGVSVYELDINGSYMTEFCAETDLAKDMITFNANGGAGTMKSQLITKSSSAPLNLNTTITRNGYTFAGWNTKADGTGTSYADGATISVGTSDIALYAKWDIAGNSYIITFDANGGTGGTGSTAMLAGAALTAPAVVRPGYTFNGWSPSVPATVPEADTTYVAQWNINSYTITFNANGGTGGSVESMQYGATLTAPPVTKAGYIFTGWSPDVPATVPAANTTYTAQWSGITYTITFNASGGTGGTGPTQMQEGDTLTAPAVSRTGYTFTGWLPLVPATVPAVSTTYVAQWSLNSYTITFNANGGSGGTDPTQIQYGATLTAPTVTKTGYTFTGWSPTVPGTVPAANTTYTAQWVEHMCSITFDASGGTGGTGPTSMQVGTVLTAPPVTKIGYTFTGWLPLVPAVVPDVNTTYVAQWSINSYTITFNANGGTGGSVTSMQYGATLTAPAVAKTGYTFINWTPNVPATVPAADTTYTAHWSGNNYTVTFDANNGTGGTGPSNIQAGDNLTSPIVARTGYTFIGWLPSVPATMPAVNTTYVAQWSINNYTITFNATGGTGGTVVSLQYGAVLTAPAVAKTGHTFNGWSPLIPATVPAADTTYNALWNVNSYTMTFDPNGGIGGSNISRQYGSVLTPPVVTRIGCVFAGWLPAVPDTVPAANTTFTAQWNKNSYIITFDANGGTGGNIGPMLFGENISPPNVTRTGYTFLGWSPIPETVPAADTTYTAQWSVNSYTITFDPNSGLGGSTSSLQYGTTLHVPTVTREGYTFAGWTPEVPATVPAANLTYTAQWSINKFIIVFDTNGGTGGTSGLFAFGDIINAPPVVRAGHTFTGWLPLVPATAPAANTTYIAQWTVNSYRIAFEANGGVGSTSDMMIFGTPLSAPAVERAGYVLTGWSPTVPTTVPAANVTYTALWSAVNYIITFDPNGGTGGTSAPMAYGSAINAPNVAKFGYTLTGWSPALPLTVPAVNTNYRAIWVANNYTITFNANGGTGGTISSMAYETPLEAPAVSKAGYTFTSWSPDVPATVPGANTTFTAQWSPNSYTIAFDANGGSGSTSSILICGNSLSAPAVARDGYDFAGWLPALPPTVPVTDTTYTAQWNPKSFTITFNANTGIGGTSGTQLCGAALVVPAVSKEGYSLTGWLPALPATVPAVSTTYIAQWTINNYTITFDAAGGIGGSITSIQYGASLSVPTVTKEGHTFNGWSPLVPATVPSRDATYTARWLVNNYTFTFNANGGFGGTSITQAFGTVITAPAVTKSGYTFSGWSPALPATMPSQSLTLIAIWTPILYDAIFVVDGTEYKRVPTACGAAIVQPANPEKSGRFFIGWDPGLPTSMPNQNLTFTALWYVFSYEVSFNLNGGTGTVPAAITAEYGSPVSLPPQGNIAKVGYIFLGWATTANAAIPLGTFSVPAANVKLYVVWGTNPILVAQSGATTIIDYTNNYIFGLEAGIKQADFESMFVKIIGNARIEITTLAGDFGTGTIVELVNNLTGLVIKTYQIVIYGDVNGDGNIDGIDAGVLVDFENGKTAWNPIADAAFIKAGDVNGDGNVDSLDAGMTIDFQNKKINIDQTPG